jgi:hypothetical protein
VAQNQLGSDKRWPTRHAWYIQACEHEHLNYVPRCQMMVFFTPVHLPFDERVSFTGYTTCYLTLVAEKQTTSCTLILWWTKVFHRHRNAIYEAYFSFLISSIIGWSKNCDWIAARHNKVFLSSKRPDRLRRQPAGTLTAYTPALPVSLHGVVLN